MRINVCYNIYLLNNPQNIKKVDKISKKLKKLRFCHASHETVTHGNSKADQFITIKLQRFWHHHDLCSIVEKWSNRDDRQTDRQTETRTPKFLLLYLVQGPQ
jgi:hypothetical protein